MKKKAQFLGDTKRAMRAFPKDARREAGYQLDAVQDGLEPTDWNHFPQSDLGYERFGSGNPAAPFA
jgi:phage-related protein